MTPILQGITALNTLFSLGRSNESATEPSLATDGRAFDAALSRATASEALAAQHDFSILSNAERLALVRQLSGEPAVITLANGSRVVGTVGYVEVRTGEAWLNVGGSQVPFDSIHSITASANLQDHALSASLQGAH